MSKKRKGRNGRLLQTGESRCKDLTYMYRFTDTNHMRITVYAQDLKTLHPKEERNPQIHRRRSALQRGKHHGGRTAGTLYRVSPGCPLYHKAELQDRAKVVAKRRIRQPPGHLYSHIGCQALVHEAVEGRPELRHYLWHSRHDQACFPDGP